MEEDRLIDSELDEEEVQYDNKLRPDKLTEYIGQKKVKENDFDQEKFSWKNTLCS